jgi:excisionase family DNA binding protein
MTEKNDIFDAAGLRNLIWDAVFQATTFYHQNNQSIVKDKNKEDEYLSTKEACAYLICSRQALYDYRTKYGLKFYKRGRAVLYLKSDLQEFVKPVQLSKTKKY